MNDKQISPFAVSCLTALLCVACAHQTQRADAGLFRLSDSIVFTQQCNVRWIRKSLPEW